VHRAIVPAYISEATHKPFGRRLWRYTQNHGSANSANPPSGDRSPKFDENTPTKWNPIRTDPLPRHDLVGEEDRLISVEDGRRLTNMIPGSILKVIPNAGHLVQDDAPEAIVAALLGFLPRP